MNINKLNSLVELYFKKSESIDKINSFLKWLKPNKPFILGEMLSEKFLN